MMELLPSLLLFLIVGVTAGILQGLVGVGMALVSVPVLTIVLPAFGVSNALAPSMALATSMASVSITGVAAVGSHIRRGNVDFDMVKTILPFSLLGITLGSLLVTRLPANVLHWIFAVFLLYTAVKMLLSARRPETSTPSSERPSVYRFAGLAIGFIASFIGAGGGVLMIPFLSGRGHSMARSVGVSSTIGLPVSVLGSLIYLAQAPQDPAPISFGYIYIPAFCGMVIGGIAAAPQGVRLVSIVSPALIKRIFALILIVVSIRLVAF